ncbi:hypothetical protein [Rhizobium halophilum]|uniref:hypothetical protein n=1 Tax=Rhizobium halophilum TaxID=2846852 RepID=UPI001EFEA536|nr:hypothetical protein [Rhizobium halophilum]MCF6368308.1 hypothetical protein [Rhizobium halophilum]
MSVLATIEQLQRMASVEDQLLQRLIRNLEDYAAVQADLDRMMQAQARIRAERSALLVEAAGMVTPGAEAEIVPLSRFRRPSLRIVQ